MLDPRVVFSVNWQEVVWCVDGISKCCYFVQCVLKGGMCVGVMHVCVLGRERCCVFCSVICQLPLARVMGIQYVGMELSEVCE